MDAIGLILSAAINNANSNIEIWPSILPGGIITYDGSEGEAYSKYNNYIQLDVPSNAKVIGYIQRNVVSSNVSYFDTLQANAVSDGSTNSYTSILLLRSTAEITKYQAYYSDAPAGGGVTNKYYWYGWRWKNDNNVLSVRHEAYRYGYNGQGTTFTIVESPILFILFY